MTQPSPIPGLITAAGVTPAAVPGQPVPAAQPGTHVPAVPVTQTAPPAQAEPVPVTQAVQAAPPPAVVAPQLPVSFGAPLSTPATAQPAAATVPGLNPAPASVPATPPAVPAPPAQQPANAQQNPATGTDGDRGYPQGTPLEQMNAEQRESYWKYHARQWESRAKERSDYDAIKSKADLHDQYVASQATETEKQIAAARADGERTATARAAVVLVDAHVRAGLGTRLAPEQVEALASNLHHQHFLAADGLTVDAAKVLTFVQTVAPNAAPAVTAPAVPATPGALPVGLPTTEQQKEPVTGLPRALPDLGQGTQTSAPLDKLEAGRQQARAFLTNGGAYR